MNIKTLGSANKIDNQLGVYKRLVSDVKHSSYVRIESNGESYTFDDTQLFIEYINARIDSLQTAFDKL